MASEQRETVQYQSGGVLITASRVSVNKYRFPAAEIESVTWGQDIGLILGVSFAVLLVGGALLYFALIIAVEGGSLANSLLCCLPIIPMALVYVASLFTTYFVNVGIKGRQTRLLSLASRSKAIRLAEALEVARQHGRAQP
jgi:hypothetical protein